MSDKDAIYNYLKQNEIMTLATADKTGKPQAATVEYVLEGDSLLFNTFTRYRKYRNMVDNPVVAGVVTTDHERTLQFDGTVEQLEGEEAQRVKRLMLQADPELGNFINDPDTRFFRITPSWMRLRDYTEEPMVVTEYTP